MSWSWSRPYLGFSVISYLAAFQYWNKLILFLIKKCLAASQNYSFVTWKQSNELKCFLCSVLGNKAVTCHSPARLVVSHSDFQVVLIEDWKSHEAVLRLGKLHFPTCNKFPPFILPHFIGVIFLLSLQGVEFQGTRTTAIKEKARLESQLKHRARDTALLREEISLLSRKDGCLFLQPSSPQDSETPTESFPVLTPETVTNNSPVSLKNGHG